MPFLKLAPVLITFWNLQISYQFFLSQQVQQNMIITNKCELTNKLRNDVRLKKISELVSSITSSSQNENIINASNKLLKTRY